MSFAISHWLQGARLQLVTIITGRLGTSGHRKCCTQMSLYKYHKNVSINMNYLQISEKVSIIP